MTKHARITLRLDAQLLKRAQTEATHQGVTLAELIERGLELVMQDSPSAKRSHTLPVCNAGGGVLPGVNLDSMASLIDRMDRGH